MPNVCKKRPNVCNFGANVYYIILTSKYAHETVLFFGWKLIHLKPKSKMKISIFKKWNWNRTALKSNRNFGNGSIGFRLFFQFFGFVHTPTGQGDPVIILPSTCRYPCKLCPKKKKKKKNTHRTSTTPLPPWFFGCWCRWKKKRESKTGERKRKKKREKRPVWEKERRE